MKTTDEIKKGLECCGKSAISCDVCPYEGECHLPFGSGPESDALAYIIQLEQRLAQAERERDAAVRDIPTACGYCKFFIPKTYKCTNKKPCACISGINTGWQWRGVCEENTKEAQQ